MATVGSLRTASVNPKPLRVCVASPRRPRHIVPSVTLARPHPRDAAGWAEAQSSPCSAGPQSPAGGSAARPRDTRGHRPRWGARQPGSTQGGDGGRAGDGVGGARRGVSSPRAGSGAGPGCWGPGASPPPLRRGVAWRLARPGDLNPTGWGSPPPAPSRVLTLLPGATGHTRNPGSTTQKMMQQRTRNFRPARGEPCGTRPVARQP